MIKGLAKAVKQPPYGMAVASDELLKWVCGEEDMAPPLDVSFCAFDCEGDGAARPAGSCAVEAVEIEDQEPEQAVGLEPAMGAVRVQSRQGAGRSGSGPEPARPPSEKARFVHDMAATLVKEAGQSWASALEQADKAWKDLGSSGAIQMEQQDASDGETILDVADPAQQRDAPQ